MPRTGFAGNGEINNTDIDLGLGDSGNITYFTPRIAGFQAIVSYTPDSSDDLAGDFDTQATSGHPSGGVDGPEVQRQVQRRHGRLGRRLHDRRTD